MQADEIPELPIRELAVRQYAVPAPDVTAYLPAVREHVSDQPVRGWLVGLRDGRRWGWWGPVDRNVAGLIPGIFAAAFPALPGAARPADLSRRLRGSIRHGHTGILAVAAGALELALWDLAAKRADLPVWALLGARAARPVPAYATCFGVDVRGMTAWPVMKHVNEIYRVQKWASGLADPGLHLPAARVVERLGPGRLAIDFHGAWHPSAVRSACAGYAGGLAWVEEPYPPDDVQSATRGEFGAPHAAGEHCYGLADTVLLERGGVEIWQPDAVFCGGMTNLLRIIRRARAAGVCCVPHGGGLLPALHAAAAGEPVDLVESHLLLEPRRLAHLADPLVTWGGPDGSITAPAAPGWCGELRGDLLDA
jgi:L-alanine-DL-glutamate epimerase-like enolase superfamily enzyme